MAATHLRWEFGAVPIVPQLCSFRRKTSGSLLGNKDNQGFFGRRVVLCAPEVYSGQVELPPHASVCAANSRQS